VGVVFVFWRANEIGASWRSGACHTSVRLLTWNLNGRRLIDRQIDAISSRSPDIVALQEVTRTSVLLFRPALLAAGFAAVLDSFANSTSWEIRGPRRYGLLIASRLPMTPRESSSLVPWPERLLSAKVATPAGPLTIHTTHIPPGSSNGWIKVEMLEAVAAVLAESAAPCILCGDFNVPQAEMSDGRIVTWAERVPGAAAATLPGRSIGKDRPRWDAAERTIMEGGAQRALVDAYRTLHGYGRQEFSWFLKRGQLRVGRRFDHVFCSRQMRISRCEYLHEVREIGLSDHSALELDFEL
jgi:exonuclease III